AFRFRTGLGLRDRLRLRGGDAGGKRSCSNDHRSANAFHTESFLTVRCWMGRLFAAPRQPVPGSAGDVACVATERRLSPCESNIVAENKQQGRGKVANDAARRKCYRTLEVRRNGAVCRR